MPGGVGKLSCKRLETTNSSVSRKFLKHSSSETVGVFGNGNGRNGISAFSTGAIQKRHLPPRTAPYPGGPVFARDLRTKLLPFAPGTGTIDRRSADSTASDKRR